MDPTIDETTLQEWVGSTQTHDDEFVVGHARRMQQTMGHDATLEPGDPLPDLWHWLYFIESVPRSGIGADGHPARGGFLPPVALPRRMWAGSRLTFEGRLRIGETATKTSQVDRVSLKQGSSGTLCFVTVHHRIQSSGGGRVTEEQDIVYREDPDPNAPAPQLKPAPENADWNESITPDPVLLFRYSALTFNGHRIHYDRPYATEVEGYDGLVIHGPLTATLLSDLATRRTGRELASFQFRGVAPLLDTQDFSINGRATGSDAELWAARAGGGLAMTASATFVD